MTSFHKPTLYISLLLFGVFHPILQMFGNFGFVDDQNPLSVATYNISFNRPSQGALAQSLADELKDIAFPPDDEELPSFLLQDGTSVTLTATGNATPKNIEVDYLNQWAITIESFHNGDFTSAGLIDFTIPGVKPAPVATGTDLYFSEYAEGSSNNKYFEIYNPTTEDISLDGYAFPNANNTVDVPGQHEFWQTFPAGHIVPANGVYIVAHPSADASILEKADHTFTFLSNGDDGFKLVKGTEGDFTVIDTLGDWQGDPGDGWPVAGISNATKDHTLVRKSTVADGNSDWTAASGTNETDSEWIVLDQDDWTNLGSHDAGAGNGATISASDITNLKLNLTQNSASWTNNGTYSIVHWENDDFDVNNLRYTAQVALADGIDQVKDADGNALLNGNYTILAENVQYGNNGGVDSIDLQSTLASIIADAINAGDDNVRLLFIPTNGVSTAARYAGQNDNGGLAPPNLSFDLTDGLEFEDPGAQPAPIVLSQIISVATIIQKERPSVLLLNEFDYDRNAVEHLRLLLAKDDVGGLGTEGIYYPHFFIAPSNTGVPSGMDLDNDGNYGDTNNDGVITVDDYPDEGGYARDAFGFGTFPGQYGMLVLSQFPIDHENARTFQKFLWKDMPNADLPTLQDDSSWYSTEELDVFRLSSKNHLNVPVLVGNETIHLIAAHPTPPVFDRPSDDSIWQEGVRHNMHRNADEVRFIRDYVNGESYIYDDEGVSGGLAANSKFVILGDMNLDPNDGDGITSVMEGLLNDPLVNNNSTPTSAGAQANSSSVENDFTGPINQHTASWRLRADYVLPSANLTIASSLVSWDETGDFANAADTASDHRMVKVVLENTTAMAEFPSAFASAEAGLRAAHISNVDDTYSFQQDVLNVRTIGEVTALIPEAGSAGEDPKFLINANSGDDMFPYMPSVKAIATVGEVDAATGLPLTGYPDGQAAWLADDNTVRVAYQSESYGTMSNETYPWEMTSGATFTGSHIHTIDYDRAKFADFLKNDTPASDMVIGSSKLFNKIYNVFGDEVVPFDQGGRWGNQTLADGTHVPYKTEMQLSQADFFLHSLCGSWYENANRYGNGIGLADDIWFAAEEWNINGSMFDDPNTNTMGLASLAVDIANGVAYTVPALGQTGYEKIMPINPGHPDYVVMVCAGYNWDIEPAPLKIYIGIKGKKADGSDLTGSENERDTFLGRNGLLYGKLYGMAIKTEDLTNDLNIASPDATAKMMDDYLKDETAADNFSVKFMPTSYQWAGWDSGVGVQDTELGLWTTEAPSEAGYIFFNGDTKTEHPAVDPDITKFRWVQNMTDEGALLGIELTDLVNELNAASGDLPTAVSADCIRIVAAIDGALTLDVADKGAKHDGTNTHATDRGGLAKTTAPDGLAWIKTADADILIIDEDSGNSQGERKFALVIDPATMELTEENKGYFLASAGGSNNPRAAYEISAYGNTFSSVTSSEFSGSFNVSALVAKKQDGSFYSKAELAGTAEGDINTSLSLDDTVLFGVVQHRGESGGAVKSFRADQGGQLFLFNVHPSIIGSTATIEVTQDITTDTTWTADNTYVLTDIIYVKDGATLTIEPGTWIMGEPQTPGNFDPGALVITQGSKIMAEGTPEHPIIFTSSDDDGLLTHDDSGLWGGVILLGKATINRPAGTEFIEGLPESQLGIYGGTDDMDSSGVMRFVSIRHGGAAIADGNEINGLTMGGVGSGTIIENIEVFANADDGFEFFGGSVNTKWLIGAFNNDDTFDWDEGFHGKGQFWFALQSETAGDNGAEMDGGPSSAPDALPYSTPVIYNATFIGRGNGNGGKLQRFRENTGGTYANSIFTGFDTGVDIREGGSDGADIPSGQDSRQRVAVGDLLLAGNIYHDIGSATDLAGIVNIGDPTFAGEVLAMMTDNGSTFADPMLGGIDRDSGEALDPRPAINSPAYENLYMLPANDPFFHPVPFKGAFGLLNWTSWSKLGSEYTGDQVDLMGLRDAHISNVDDTVPFDRYLNDLKSIGEITATVAEASTAGGRHELLKDGMSGDTDFPFMSSLKTIATVGEYDRTNGQVLTGYPDGQAAWLADDDTVRVVYQSESYATMSSETYPWVMANGASFTGSHIHTIDYDRAMFAEFLGNNAPASDMVIGSGKLFDTVYNVFGDEVVPLAQGGRWGNNTLADGTIVPWASGQELSQADFFFQSFCGSWYEKAERYGTDLGFEDDIWFTSEEWNINRSMFGDSANDETNTMGLASLVVDIANRTAYTVPALGQSGYEKLMPINPGHPDYVVIVAAGYNWDIEPAPLKIYVGVKGKNADGSDLTGSENARDTFLGRNGLLYGKLYGMAITSADLTGLNITNQDPTSKMMDNYLKDDTAPDNFNVEFMPTTYQWGGWDNSVGTLDTEMLKWTTENPGGDANYIFFNGDTKTEHPAVDPDITKFRWVQNMTDEGALLGITLTDIVNELTAANGDLPASVSASCVRIVAAVDGALTLEVGDKGVRHDGVSTHAEDRNGEFKTTAPDGLAWIKTADADVLIVDEDSGNSGGERKFALVIDPETMELTEANTGYFLAAAGGSQNPRAAMKSAAYPGTYSSATSSEFSGTWNVSAFVAKKQDGSFYTKAELAGTMEQVVNESVALNDSTLLGVVQQKGESGGIIKDFRADQGGQIFLFQPDIPLPVEGQEILVTENITTDTTWYAHNTYVLTDIIYVTDGATLTIEPGTWIMGEPESVGNFDPGALVITQGSKIHAVGKKDDPIVFTSIDDDGDLTGSDSGLWGGVILLGKATINRPAGTEFIEGLPESALGIYGGNDDMDSSGMMKYVSIRHGGAAIADGNEINGLTMGGVGAGTVIEYIEVFANADDGFEFFGGTVNTKYLIGAFNSDDTFDWDEGFRGKGQFWFAIQSTDSGDNIAEMDGGPSSAPDARPFARPVIYNATLIGRGSANGSKLMRFRENTGGIYANSIMTGFQSGVDIRTGGSDGAPIASGQDSERRVAVGDLALIGNIFYDIDGATDLSGVVSIGDSGASGTFAADVIATLNANGNSFEDPMLAGIARVQGTGLDPRPANNGPAYENLAPLPRGDLFYKMVDHKGAFGDEDWTAGWSKIGTEYTGDIFQEIDLPEVTIEGDEKIVLFVGESYNEGGATAVDGAGQNIGNVTTSGSVDTNTPGVYHITYTAEDGQGNTRTAVREVTVLEKTLTGDLNAGIHQIGSIEIDAGSEIVAFHPDSNTVFVVAGDIVEAINISDPTAPVAIDTIELDADAQSVAISGNLMALAVAAPTGKTDIGSVLFYKIGVNGKPKFEGEIMAGPLPDSLAFSPDGSVLVVANEGEPNDFYDVDPEGSITVISVVRNNPAASKAVHIDFKDWNGRAGELKAKGIRISGTGTVAQDIEPEYVTISKDGMVAYVTLQENNAVAKVDISDPMNPSLMAIYSAGIKDWERGLAKATNVEFTIDYPSSTPRPDANGNGQVDPGEVTAGGLSGLWYAGKNESNEDVFYTISDRGPQAFDIGGIAGDDPSDPNHGEKIFADPDFPITIYELTRDASGNVTQTDVIILKAPDGQGGYRNTTGIGQLDIDDLAFTPVGIVNNFNSYTEVPRDAFGLDTEAVLKLVLPGINNGDPVFAVCDEYRPQIALFDAATGNMIHRIVPEDTDYSSVSYASGRGDVAEYTLKTLPAVYSQRRGNRGFEALAYNSKDGLLYAFIQSPMSVGGSRSSSLIRRIIAVDPLTGEPQHEYVYMQSGPGAADKIGDAVYDAAKDVFYVIDRDSGTTMSSDKSIIEFNLKGSTDTLPYTLNGMWEDVLGAGKTAPEMVAAAEVSGLLEAAGIEQARQFVLFNLPSVGGEVSFDKPEGLALMDDGSLVVGYDNDFVSVDGRPDNLLSFISFKKLKVDTSDRDGGFAFSQRNFYGLNMPDGIAAFSTESGNFYATANEGDGRVRPDDVNFETGDDFAEGFYRVSEEDPGTDGVVEVDEGLYLVPTIASFDGAFEVEADEEYFVFSRNGVTGVVADDEFYNDESRADDANQMIGGDRLKLVNTEMFEQPIGFGGRSFTIYDDKGNIVYDSGDLLDRMALEAGVYPDGRSDDKGSEPEGVVIAESDGKMLAFIALERANAIAVFDVTDPVNSMPMGILTSEEGREGPEGLIFISREDSPTGKDLLIVANEADNTGLDIFEFGEPRKPRIQLKGDETITVIVGEDYNDRGALAGEYTGDIVVTGSVNTSQEGTYTITYDVVDANGVAAETVTRTINVVQEGGTVQVTANITEDTTWTREQTYVLTDIIYVTNGATLTIEPGTTIQGEPQTPGNFDPGALVITQGSKIMAMGTAKKPIVFTSTDDDGLLTSQDSGLWGGVILLGNATINRPAGTEYIEGLPESDLGIYGGTDDEDSSGALRFVSIRHGGAAIADGNEINGLTFGGVGSGTKVEYIEVYANADDGFEFFGGTVNTKYLIGAFNNDDTFDWDEGFRGNGQFWFAIQSDLAGDNGAEMDGGPSSAPDAEPYSMPTIYNATFIGRGSSVGGSLMRFRENTGGKYINSIFTEFQSGLDIRTGGADGANIPSGEDSEMRVAEGDLALESNLFYDIAGASDLAGIVNIDGAAGANGTFKDDVTTMLNFLGNSYADPQLGSVSRDTDGGLDPRPADDGPAYTNLSALPAGDDFFRQVSFKGAFGYVNWAKGWSFLAQSGAFGEAAATRHPVVRTADDLGSNWFRHNKKGIIYSTPDSEWVFQREVGYLFNEPDTNWFFSADTGLGWVFIDDENVSTEDVGTTQSITGNVYSNALRAWVYITSVDNGNGTTTTLIMNRKTNAWDILNTRDI